MQESQDGTPQGQGYNIVFFGLVYVFYSYKINLAFQIRNLDSFGVFICMLPWNMDFVS